MTNVREAERVGPFALGDAVPALDGSITVRAALEARARETGLDADRLARAALPVVRRLFELGYLKLQSSAARWPTSRVARVELTVSATLGR